MKTLFKIRNIGMSCATGIFVAIFSLVLSAPASAEYQVGKQYKVGGVIEVIYTMTGNSVSGGVPSTLARVHDYDCSLLYIDGTPSKSVHVYAAYQFGIAGDGECGFSQNPGNTGPGYYYIEKEFTNSLKLSAGRMDAPFSVPGWSVGTDHTVFDLVRADGYMVSYGKDTKIDIATLNIANSFRNSSKWFRVSRNFGKIYADATVVTPKKDDNFFSGLDHERAIGLDLVYPAGKFEMKASAIRLNGKAAGSNMLGYALLLNPNYSFTDKVSAYTFLQLYSHDARLFGMGVDSQTVGLRFLLDGEDRMLDLLYQSRQIDEENGNENRALWQLELTQAF